MIGINRSEARGRLAAVRSQEQEKHCVHSR